MSVSNKRKRSSNFSKEEELHLMNSIEVYKSVIECKTTNKLTSGEKDRAWNKILNEFNSKTCSVRTLEQLKSKYENLKTKARKEAAQDKRYIRGTGGGPPASCSGGGGLDPVTEAVLRVVNKTTVMGLESSYDCDATTDAPEVMHVSHLEDESIPIIEQSAEYNNSFVFEESNIPSSSTAPIINARENTDTGKNNKDWSEYVPRKLKEKINKKLTLKTLRSNPVLISKEVYYKRKLELLEKTFEEETKERNEKGRREEEEHEKKMRLLDLQIQRAKKQLEIII